MDNHMRRHFMKFRIVTIVAVALAWAAGASAQQGTADLQYRAPIASPVTYVTVDSTDLTISGLPVGEMTARTHARTLSEVIMAPADVSGSDLATRHAQATASERFWKLDTRFRGWKPSGAGVTPYERYLREVAGF
jgi:hypothetical protein